MKKQNLRVCYFMGNISSHCPHALPLFKELGGQFVTLSNQTALEINSQGLPAVCIDDRPDLFLGFDRKISKTINYIENNFDIVVFYELFTFSFLAYVKKIPTVFLSHGNMLKTFMWPKRLKALKKYRYLASLSPALKEKFIHEYKINPSKLLDVGIARNDAVSKNKGDVLFSRNFLEKTNLDTNKPFISYIPTWWGISTVQSIGLDFINNFPPNYNLLFRPHPQTPVDIIEKYQKIIDLNDNMVLVDALSLEEQFDASSLLVGDLSSVVLEWILTDKPLIFIYEKNKDYRKDLHSIKEVVSFCCSINEVDVSNISSAIEKALKINTHQETWDTVKNRAFYGYKGDSTYALVQSLKKLCAHD